MVHDSHPYVGTGKMQVTRSLLWSICLWCAIDSYWHLTSHFYTQSLDFPWKVPIVANAGGTIFKAWEIFSLLLIVNFVFYGWQSSYINERSCHRNVLQCLTYHYIFKQQCLSCSYNHLYCYTFITLFFRQLLVVALAVPVIHNTCLKSHNSATSKFFIICHPQSTTHCHTVRQAQYNIPVSYLHRSV